jgi:hypothetical protein
MLFNLCNCAAPLASSAGPLCIGGAGFVTAVIATLAANARTREVKRLCENVPEMEIDLPWASSRTISLNCSCLKKRATV